MKGTRIARWLGILSLLLTGAGSTFAQSPRAVTIELKNGTLLKGEMAVTVQEDYLTLVQEDQPLLHIPYRRIRNIGFGTQPASAPTQPRSYLGQDRQFFHLGEINVLAGSRRYAPNTAVGFHTVNGYHVNPHLGIGLGVGVDHYGLITTLPVYLSVRGAGLKRRISPYYFASAGGSTAWGHDPDGSVTRLRASGGWMLHAGLGYQFNFARSALLIHGGFKSQQTELSYRQDDGWGTRSDIEEKRTIRRISFGIGVML